ncbi:cytochrome oxidase biogenesis protein Surf1,facilitates heme A insertion [Pseudomonas floridensis]|uniref:SURF1-like protein n=1 Tax=Pseudomonas floridensis TaxID=1958950 RepID=A0A1X0NBQ7_9PSED|nr:SURF1 family protein [Pseudomonas floridensis]ORC61736.1 cytochrome oxidase biogenesis protein Surf1,facilitates heme A insertion [Pseudomonas floridensis]
MNRFKPGLWPTLIVLLLLPVLASLGFWQLDRGEQKRMMLDLYAERRSAEPVAIGAVLYVEDAAWRRVHVRGRFDAEHSVLMDNSIREGHVGVELLQPFVDHASGLWLLINRGWLPWQDRRTTPVFTTPDRVLELDAWVYLPTRAAFQLQADTPQGSWPRLVTAVAADQLWNELGREGYPDELRLEPGPAAYRVDWPVVAISPEKHTAYAVQWFALSTALLGLYLYRGWFLGRASQEDAHGNRHEPRRPV